LPTSTAYEAIETWLGSLIWWVVFWVEIIQISPYHFSYWRRKEIRADLHSFNSKDSPSYQTAKSSFCDWPIPHETSPIRYHCVPERHTRGDPPSPCYKKNLVFLKVPMIRDIPMIGNPQYFCENSNVLESIKWFWIV
jgi:hypothetical protein